mmetsp:Transcript_26732/g.53309  ORF Transcript_26732/g.53309 Transcript_26732/m.53309 type:complete len:196 (+) Transcript_26732:448-1035(+)
MNAPEVVIATRTSIGGGGPSTGGRLYTVVYNASDRLFEKGFTAQLQEIMRSAPSTRQSLFFSATMPASIDLESAVSDELHMAFLLTLGVGAETMGPVPRRTCRCCCIARTNFGCTSCRSWWRHWVRRTKKFDEEGGKGGGAATVHEQGTVNLTSRSCCGRALILSDGLPATTIYKPVDLATRRKNLSEFRLPLQT